MTKNQIIATIATLTTVLGISSYAIFNNNSKNPQTVNYSQNSANNSSGNSNVNSSSNSQLISNLPDYSLAKSSSSVLSSSIVSSSSESSNIPNKIPNEIPAQNSQEIKPKTTLQTPIEQTYKENKAIFTDTEYPVLNSLKSNKTCYGDYFENNNYQDLNKFYIGDRCFDYTFIASEVSDNYPTMNPNSYIDNFAPRDINKLKKTLNTVMKDYANRVNGTLVSDKISLVMSVDWSQNKTHQVRISADDPKLFALVNPNVRTDNSEMQPEVYLLNEDQNEEWNWEYICNNNYSNNQKQFFIGDRCYVYSFSRSPETDPNNPRLSGGSNYNDPIFSIPNIDFIMGKVMNDFATRTDSKLVSNSIILDFYWENKDSKKITVTIRASDPAKFLTKYPDARTDFFPVNEYIYTISQEHTGGYGWELTSSDDNY
jgi:hypothetical protein